MVTPETASNARRTAIGRAVEPDTKWGLSEDRSSPCGGDLASTENMVGTPDRRVRRKRSTNFQ